MENIASDNQCFKVMILNIGVTNTKTFPVIINDNIEIIVCSLGKE